VEEIVQFADLESVLDKACADLGVMPTLPNFVTQVLAQPAKTISVCPFPAMLTAQIQQTAERNVLRVNKECVRFLVIVVRFVKQIVIVF